MCTKQIFFFLLVVCSILVLVVKVIAFILLLLHKYEENPFLVQLFNDMKGKKLQKYLVDLSCTVCFTRLLGFITCLHTFSVKNGEIKQLFEWHPAAPVHRPAHSCCTLWLRNSSTCCSWTAAFPVCPNLSLHDFMLILGLLPSGLTHFRTVFTVARRYSLGHLHTVFRCSGFRISLNFLAITSICDIFFSDCFTNIRVWFGFFFFLTPVVCLTLAKTSYYKVWSPIIQQ